MCSNRSSLVCTIACATSQLEQKLTPWQCKKWRPLMTSRAIWAPWLYQLRVADKGPLNACFKSPPCTNTSNSQVSGHSVMKVCRCPGQQHDRQAVCLSSTSASDELTFSSQHVLTPYSASYLLAPCEMPPSDKCTHGNCGIHEVLKTDQSKHSAFVCGISLNATIQ